VTPVVIDASVGSSSRLTRAALLERERSGLGQEVDVAIYEAVFALMEFTLAEYERSGVVRGRSGSVLPGVAPSNVYPTADGSDVLIAANADSVFRRLCEAMGTPDLPDDDRYRTHEARGRNMEELDDRIAASTRSLQAEELLAVLERHAIPAGQI
jgi:crotonobetainyl-CoA:carnitine CoA-transferase CaiB-like acyl-CoA transferase